MQMNYRNTKKAIEEAPTTWLLGLLIIVIQRILADGLFKKPEGLVTYVQQVADEYEKFFRQQREEYMSYVSDDIQALLSSKTVITTETLSRLRLNSYERQLLYKNMDNECLLKEAKYCIDQSWGEFRKAVEKYPDDVASTYNEILKTVIIHELIARLEGK